MHNSPQPHEFPGLSTAEAGTGVRVPEPSARAFGPSGSRTDQDVRALASSLGPRHSAAEPPHPLRRPTDAGVGSAAGDVLLTPSSGPESGELATCGVLNQ